MGEDTGVTAAFDTTIVLSEDFATGDLPGGWTRVITSGDAWWWFDWPHNVTGGLSYTALGAAWGLGPFDIALRTFVLDLSTFDRVGLEFKTDIGTAESTADVDVSLNGGGTWTNVWRNLGRLGGPRTIDIDLSTRAGGRSAVMLRFRIHGSSVWWTIDDVRVMAYKTLAVPAVTSLAINGGATSTTSPVVTLNNTATGSPTEYQASESSSFAGATWQPYSTAPSFMLSAANGLKRVYFRVRHADGISTARNDVITLSADVPAVTALAINGGAASTTSRLVVLNNTVAGSPTHYQASESSTFAGALWAPYSIGPSFTLSAANGVKRVYFRVATNGGVSASRYDTITLNAPVPTVTSLAINGGATSTTSRVVTLNNTATGSPTHYQASESSTFAGAPWLPYSAAPSLTLSAANGVKRVYVRVRNAEGTVSTVRSDTISLVQP
jgi:hypothetical protein